MGSMGIVDGGTLAYLTLRQLDKDETGPPSYELGVCAYGPEGTGLAGRLADRIRDWDRDGGQDVELCVEVHPAGARLAPGAFLVVDKQFSRVVIWMSKRPSSRT